MGILAVLGPELGAIRRVVSDGLQPVLIWHAGGDFHALV